MRRARRERIIREIESEGPQPEDIGKEPTGRLGSQISVGEFEGKYIGTFPNDKAADRAIRAYMNSRQMWPNVWTISDHGNVSLDTSFRRNVGGRPKKVVSVVLE